MGAHGVKHPVFPQSPAEGSVGEEPDIQQMVVQLRPGEVAQMRMAVEETTSTEYLYRGELQEPEAAKRHLHAAAEAWMSSAQERPHKQARSHRVYNTADKDVQPWYKKWTCRLVSWDELVVQVRQDMAEFTQAAAAATDPSELDTQAPTVPATLQYESWSGEGAAVDIDNAETVPMGIFPESAPQWKLRVDVLRRRRSHHLLLCPARSPACMMCTSFRCLIAGAARCCDFFGWLILQAHAATVKAHAA